MRTFYPLTILLLISFGLLLSVESYGQLFQQNFNSSTQLSTYTSSPAANERFSAFTTSGNGTVIIEQNALALKTRGGSSAASYSRVGTLKFSPAPTALMYRFTLSASNLSTTSVNNAGVWQVGSGFNTNSTRASTGVFSNVQLALSTTGFSINNSAFFAGTQQITWVVNRSDGELTYLGPDQRNATIAAGREDVWVGQTKVVVNRAVVAAGAALEDIKFVLDANDATVLIDNMIIDPIPASPLASAASNIEDNKLTANWQPVTGWDTYLDVARDQAFTDMLTGYNNIRVAGASLTVTGLQPNRQYFYRVRAQKNYTMGVVTSAHAEVQSATTLSSITLAGLSQGIAPSPLKAGSENKALLGFTISSSGAASLNSFRIGLSSEPSGKINNIRLVASADNSFSTTNDNTEVTTGVVSNSSIEFNATTSIIANTSYYYFIVADIDAAATGNTAPIQLSLRAADMVVSSAIVRGSNVESTNYSFISKPVKLAITAVSPALPVAGESFNVTIKAVDMADAASDVESNIAISLSANGNAGDLTGTVTGTMLAGTNTLTISDLRFSNGGTGVRLTATDVSSAPELSEGISSLFNVLAEEPTHQASNLRFTSVTPHQLGLSWSQAESEPAGYIVIKNAGTAPAGMPLDGQFYTVGQNAAGGIVAYIGNNVSFNDPELLPNTNYFYNIFSFNGSGEIINYKQSNPLQQNRSTLAEEPLSQPTSFTINTVSSSSLGLSWEGGGINYMVVARQSAAVASQPLDGNNYLFGTAFNNAPVLDDQDKIVYLGSAKTITVTGLLENTEYHFAVYSYNGNLPNLSANFLTSVAPARVSRRTLVTEPTAQPSNLLFLNLKQSGYLLSWTASNPASTGYLVLRKTGTVYPAAVPVDGVVYSAGAYIANDASVVAYVGPASQFEESALHSATQYSYSLFSYNGEESSINYRELSPLYGQRFTLANEPANQVTNLSATAFSTTEIRLAWTPVTGAAGYMILRSSSDYPKTTGFNDGQAPTGIPAGTVLLQHITNGSASSFNNTGLTANTAYYYSIIAYGHNGNSDQTYNYLTSQEPAKAMAYTASGASDMIAVAGSESLEISSLVNDPAPLGSAGGVKVWELTIRDGGAAMNDQDALPTVVTEIILTRPANSTLDWSQVINAVALVEGGAVVGSNHSITANQVRITGLNLSVPDNGSKTIGVRLSIKSSIANTVIDNRFLVFQANFITSATGSSQKLASMPVISSAGDKNKINVVATRLGFSVGPVNTDLYAAMPAVKTEARDVNGNRDVDFQREITISSSGGMEPGSLTVTAVNGEATFINIVHYAVGNGLRLSVFANNLTTSQSNPFNIQPGAASYKYRSLANGNYNSAASWQQALLYDDDNDESKWSTASYVPHFSGGAIRIRHSITINSNNLTADQLIVESGAKLLIASGGTLTINNGDGIDVLVKGVLELEGSGGLNASAASVEITAGGTFNNNVNNASSVTVSQFIIRNGGAYRHNAMSSNANGNTMDFPGTTMDFAPQSTVELLKWGNGGTSLNPLPAMIVGNLIINMASLNGSWNQKGAITNIMGDLTVLGTGGGTREFQFQDMGNLKITLGGNLTIHGGIIDIGSGGNSSGNDQVIDLHGDFRLTGGTFKFSRQKKMLINFKRSGQDQNRDQVFYYDASNATLVNNNIDWTIVAGSRLILNSNLPVTASGLFTNKITIEGELVAGEHQLTGTGLLDMRAGGTLHTAHLNGVAGTVALTGSRTYSAEANYVFTATGKSQQTGFARDNIQQANSLGVNAPGSAVNLDRAFLLQGNALSAESSRLSLVQGILKTTSANLLTLSAVTTASMGSSTTYVEGPLAKVTGSTAGFIFPIGKGGRLGRLEITPSSAMQTTFLAEYFARGYGSYNRDITTMPAISKIEYWSLSRVGGTANAAVKLYWGEHSAVGVEEEAVRAIKVAWWDSEGSIWKVAGNSPAEAHQTSGNSFSGWVQSPAVDKFGIFTLGSGNEMSPLPVTLISFTAKYNNGAALLHWSTAMEEKNLGFEVERSSDGVNFQKIGFVQGAINSNEIRKYRYTDVNFQDIAYYRLKQIDLDGSHSYSDLVVVRSILSGKTAFTIYPNPVAEEVKLIYNDQAEADLFVKIKLLSADGRSILLLEGNLRSLNVEFNEKLKQLNSGLYLLQVLSEGKATTIKMIKD